MLEGEVERVEDREELLHQALGGALEVFGLLLDDALLVVLEVGLQPLQRIEVVVALARDLLDVVLDGRFSLRDGAVVRLLGGNRGIGNRLRHFNVDLRVLVGHYAPCSSTISASTTSSSLGVEVPPSGPAPPAACC